MPFSQDSALPVHSVCVYCGSSSHVDDSYKKIAEDVGAALAEHNLRVIYGGGHVGLMGVLADAALKAGGEVIGIIPEHIRAMEVQHTRLTELVVVDSMHIRKRMMFDRADAFVVLPGGFGTLDETFEVMTWKHIGLHNKPIVIYNHLDFWNPLLTLMNHVMISGFAPQSNADRTRLYRIANNIEELFAALAAPAGPIMDPAMKWF